MNVDRPCVNSAFVLQTILILGQIPSKLPTRRESGSSPRYLEVGVRATRHVCDLSTTVQGQVDCEHILYTKQQVKKVGGVKRTCGKGMHSSCKRNESSSTERKSDAGILGRRVDLAAGFLIPLSPSLSPSHNLKEVSSSRPRNPNLQVPRSGHPAHA